MTDDGKRDLFFIIYMLVVMLLAVIYFTVPERAEFFEYQLKWWEEFWNAIKALIYL